jgi:hypothetical protein
VQRLYILALSIIATTILISSGSAVRAQTSIADINATPTPTAAPTAAPAAVATISPTSIPVVATATPAALPNTAGVPVYVSLLAGVLLVSVSLGQLLRRQ